MVYPDLADLHYERLDGKETARLAACLDLLERLDLDYVLGGGWAVFAFDARVPSIDVDLYIENAAPLTKALQEMGISTGPGKYVETMSMTGPVEIWGASVPGLGLPELAVSPVVLFEGKTVHRTIHLEGRDYLVKTPAPHALAAAKAIALHNRSLAYRATFDGEAGMLLGPELSTQLKALSENYWLRKAGKDAFDVASLIAAHPTSVEDIVALFVRLEMGEALAALARPVPSTVMDLARALAARVGAADPRPIIGTMQQAFSPAAE